MKNPRNTSVIPLRVRDSQRPASLPYTPVFEELKPAPDRWSIVQRLAGTPGLLFLDSALLHSAFGRYSFIAAHPSEWIEARGNQTWLSGKLVSEHDPFHLVSEWLSSFRCATIDGLPPFQGGAAGLFGYDLCHHLERLPRPEKDEFEAPDMAMGIYDWAVAFDDLAGRAWLISTGFPETDPRRRTRRAEQRLHEAMNLLNRGGGEGHLHAPNGRTNAIHIANQYSVDRFKGVLSNFDRSTYLKTVEKILEYIRAGDCFQVNLAQRLLHRAALTPLELYRRLRERNAAPFAGFFDMGEFAIASASPERFLRVQGGRVETRPIKGTWQRGSNPAEDSARISDLLGSTKDRAENVMIVDLLRNDLGRVCEYGSVQVAAVCQLESFPYVHHLVSEVRGQLRTELGAIDVLRAAFPGGSVTGAPKIRAMEIIAELESCSRGPYCGSLGYIGFDGSMDTNILIRTCTIGKGWVQFPVGGGIVADSIPEQEYEETWAKAAGILHALD